MTRRARLQKERLRGSERRASKGAARTAAAIDGTVNEV